VLADFFKASVDVMSTAADTIYTGTKGVQEPDHKEGSEVIDNLEFSVSGPKGTFEKGDWEIATGITNEEELEILA
jgi:hypothetical protein